jgi:hypothetical protein
MEKNINNNPTRQELHELVWRLPMQQAAAQFSVPAQTLSTICRQNDIPVPPSGHWSKVKSGRLVAAKPLPRPEDDGNVAVARQGRGGGNRRPPKHKAKRRREWVLRAGSLTDYQPKTFYVGALKESIRQQIRGGKTVIHTHKRSEFRISILPESAARTVRLLDQVCLLAHTYSMDIRPSDDGLAFSKGGYDVPIVITEQVSADRHPEGRLEIRVDNGHHNDGIQRRFADSRHRYLEEQASLVAKSLVCSADGGRKRLGIDEVPDRETVATGSVFGPGKTLDYRPCRLSASLVELEEAARRCRMELNRGPEMKANLRVNQRR